MDKSPWKGMPLVPIDPNRQQPLPKEQAFWDFNGSVGPNAMHKPPETLPMEQMPYAPGVDPGMASLYTQAYGAEPPPPPAPPGGGGGGGGGGGFFTDYEKALQSLKERSDGLAGAQARSAEPLRRDMMNQTVGDIQYDLSPLAALVDTWSGSRLAQSYKNPETGRERQDTIRKLQSGVSGAEMQSEATKFQGLRDLAAGQFDLGKLKQDQDYKNKMLGMEQEKLGIERLKAGTERLKTGGKSQGRILGESAIKDYGELQGVVALADDLDNVIVKSASLMGPVEGLWTINPWNSTHKKVQAKFDLVRQKIGKMLEGGVLRKEDEEKYTKIMPVLTDKPGVARDKSRQLSILLRKDLARVMDNYGRAGYNVSGFADQTGGYMASGGKTGGEANEWGLAVGQNIDGRKYLGGHPNNEASWE